MALLGDWRWRRPIKQRFVPPEDWQRVEATLPILAGMLPEERLTLREHAQLFLREKSIVAVQGLELTEPQRLGLALQACLPILEMGLDWYDGWYTVIVYPGEFISRHEVEDDLGLVHSFEEARSGESWSHGPVILSWEDITQSGQCEGYNVIIHELAHKLDMLNGDPNGFPPLDRSMSAEEWSAAFQQAFDDMNARLENGEETAIDPYAAEEPGEFFAVTSEYFFELPHLLREEYPEVYRQLAQFYRQDPARRLPPR